MIEESRYKRYLRILENGVKGESDYEDAKYLIDKGYLSGEYLKDYTEASDTIYSVVSNGLTAAGLDYLEELRVRCNPDQRKFLGSLMTSISSNLVGIFYTVLGGLVLAAVLFLINEHFGIQL